MSKSVEIKGMAELIDKIERYHESPKKVGNKALKEASNIMLDSERATLLKMHNKDRSTGKGAKNLKVGRIRSYAGGSKYVGVGFTKDKIGDGENWKNIKGAYFAHYGYHEHRSGKYMAGSNWLGVAFDNASSACYNVIKSTLLAEFNSIK